MASTRNQESEKTARAPEAVADAAAGAVAAAGGERSMQDTLKEVLNSITHPENLLLENAFVQVENSTKLPREQIVYGAGGVVGLYLIFGSLAQLICNFIGFGYPAYASVKAIRTSDKEDDTQWLVYWTVFAFFSLLDTFAEKIMGIFPVYWLVKALFFMYLSAPATRGAAKLYKTTVDPFITKIDAWYATYSANHASSRSAAETKKEA